MFLWLDLCYSFDTHQHITNRTHGGTHRSEERKKARKKGRQRPTERANHFFLLIPFWFYDVAFYYFVLQYDNWRLPILKWTAAAGVRWIRTDEGNEKKTNWNKVMNCCCSLSAFNQNLANDWIVCYSNWKSKFDVFVYSFT